MNQPELPIDPPSTIDDTPVDHMGLAQSMLRDVEFELGQADIGTRERALLAISVGILQDHIELLR